MSIRTGSGITAFMTTRREKLRHATVEEIKSIAWEMIQGNIPVTIHSITRQMGMTAPAFYTYFKSREALMAELVRDSLDQFHRALTAPFPPESSRDITGIIFTTFIRYRRWAVRHPSAFSMFAGRPVPGIPQNHGRAAFPAEQGHRLFFELFEQARCRGHLQIPESTKVLNNAPPGYAAMLASVKEALNLDAGPEVIHRVIQVVGLVHGLISMELSDRFSEMVEDGELMFTIQVSEALERAGFIQKPLPDHGPAAVQK